MAQQVKKATAYQGKLQINLTDISGNYLFKY